MTTEEKYAVAHKYVAPPSTEWGDFCWHLDAEAHHCGWLKEDHPKPTRKKASP